MRAAVLRLLLVILLSLQMTGCWDQKVVQDIHYVTALGVDYEQGTYKVYAQLLDFSTVAKQESGKPQQEMPVWIGKGDGATVDLAMNELYDSAQERLSLSHTTVIVLSERAFRQGVTSLLDSVNRFREFRYTPWVYGTKADLQELLTATPLFNLSPLLSLLHEPMDIYQQHSKIPPITMKDFVMRYWSPADTLLVPMLTINRSSRKEGKKAHSLLEIKGALAIHQTKYVGVLTDKEIEGYRWTTNETVRSPLLVRDEKGKVLAVLSVEKLTVRTHVSDQGGKPVLHYRIKARIYVGEKADHLSETPLKSLVDRKIAEEVRATFTDGLQRGIDVLGLEGYVYHQQNELWKRTFHQVKSKVREDMLGPIEVDVNLLHSGKLKLR